MKIGSYHNWHRGHLGCLPEQKRFCMRRFWESPIWLWGLVPICTVFIIWLICFLVQAKYQHDLLRDQLDFVTKLYRLNKSIHQLDKTIEDFGLQTEGKVLEPKWQELLDNYRSDMAIALADPMLTGPTLERLNRTDDNVQKSMQLVHQFQPIENNAEQRLRLALRISQELNNGLDHLDTSIQESRTLIETGSLQLQDRRWQLNTATIMACFLTLLFLLFWNIHRQTKESLNQVYQMQEDLIDTVDGIVWEVDVPSFRFTFVSQRAERILGYPLAMWLEDENFWKDHLHKEDRDRALAFCIKATQEQTDHEMEYRMIAADGSTVWLRDLVTIVVENGRPTKLRGIMVDITNQKRAQESLLETQTRLRLVNEIAKELSTGHSTHEIIDRTLQQIHAFFPGLRLAYSTVDEQGRLTFLQEKEPTEVQSISGTPIDFNLVPDYLNALRRCEPIINEDTEHDDRLAPLADVLKAGSIRAMLTLPVRHSEQLAGLLCFHSSVPRKWSNHEVLILKDVAEYLAIVLKEAHVENLRNLSEEAVREAKRNLEQALDKLENSQKQIIQQERLRALGEMTSGVAHDFNNALSPVLGYAELLLADPKLPPEFRDRLKWIHTGARDAAAVVSRLQHFCGGQGAVVLSDTVNLAELIREIPDLTRPKWRDEALRTGRVIDVQLELCETAHVLGNASELRELFINLLMNAVDAMPQGGQITIRLISQPPFAVVEVSDSGAGMTEEVCSRCFEPFFTTKGSSGAGLGLSVCHGIIQRHNGRIEMDTTPGQGTTVRVHLRTASDLDRTPIHDVASGSLPVWRVLYIDDDPQVRKVVARMLEQLGQKVDVATSGSEGLTLMQAHPYDVVITDLGMPEMDGREVTRAVKDHYPETPVIMLTGWGDSPVAELECPEVKPDEVMGKPPTLAKMSTALGRLRMRLTA